MIVYAHDSFYVGDVSTAGMLGAGFVLETQSGMLVGAANDFFSSPLSLGPGPSAAQSFWVTRNASPVAGMVFLSSPSLERNLPSPLFRALNEDQKRQLRSTVVA